ncbi:MAG: polyhydroxyalkanoate synthesis regulator DNA-binding domain-containing protein [Candidatus Promineifilaceae bacterium]
MPVIKRYPNRKLYDTEAKKYITLDGIADLIRQGEEVQVIDHNTDEDLTAVTLTQIIFEQEKKKGGFLPKSVLTGLVQAGGDTVNTLRRTLSSPLGLLRQVDEEIERRLQILISRGDLAVEEGKKLRDKLLAAGQQTIEESETAVESRLNTVLNRSGIPTRDEYEKLVSQIDELTAKLDELTQKSDNN